MTKRLALGARMPAVSALSPIEVAVQPSLDNHIPFERFDLLPVISMEIAGTGIWLLLHM